ncbi:pirin family protein [Vagococcus zengguangii]|uniref:Pirin family protein n=1 Tax=Vagococcus zengguangii TaxID=2571750 RepID=A0A4D7CU03_9ENTE|nr:pirin family protein [Vagococcus zengguangii]QCI85820.1 pirin family protein [Vagococcus zengguangii]
MIKGKVYPVEGARIPVQNPYILAAHHLDAYPAGNGEMAPIEFPIDWEKGNDFSSTRGWKMYHGEYVPGFPAHPHRGFQTITYAKTGYIDHFDSHGNYGRYGNGDVQWMVAGKGMQHAEMFPLVNTDQPNPFEIVQIWLNLPAKMKMVEGSYEMHWREELPTVVLDKEKPSENYLKVLAGSYLDASAPKPSEVSYGHDENHYVNIWEGQLEQGKTLTIPQFPEEVPVQLFIRSGEVSVDGNKITAPSLLVYTSDSDVDFTVTEALDFMVFTGKTIDEEVFAYGPFVMTTREEVVEAYNDFERTEFGGWLWESGAPIIPADEGRFSVNNHGQERRTPPTQ